MLTAVPDTPHLADGETEAQGQAAPEAVIHPQPAACAPSPSHPHAVAPAPDPRGRLRGRAGWGGALCLALLLVWGNPRTGGCGERSAEERKEALQARPAPAIAPPRSRHRPAPPRLPPGDQFWAKRRQRRRRRATCWRGVSAQECAGRFVPRAAERAGAGARRA